jgi:hypothetical protein
LKGSKHVVIRVLIAALIVGGSGALAAQGGPTPQLPSDGIHQVRVFETYIRGGLVRAGQQIADRARAVVPDIALRLATSVQLWVFFARRQPTGPAVKTGEPVAAPAPTMTNPEREYSEYVRQSLIDVILDNGPSLPIKDGQTLTIVETGGEATNPLAEPPKKLYLRIKGEDLIALRQNRITRDVAKQRILEERRY